MYVLEPDRTCGSEVDAEKGLVRDGDWKLKGWVLWNIYYRRMVGLGMD